MSTPTPQQIFETLDVTWPAADLSEAGGFTIRNGAGGGKRVSAATPIAGADQNIEAAENAMSALGQTPLFMIRGEDSALDADLATRGYDIVDPVVIYSAPIDTIAAPTPQIAVFDPGEPMAIQREIWAEAGIGPARLAIMDRAPQPKTSLLGRSDDRPGAAAFIAIHEETAMLHALEVRPRARRLGTARHIMQYGSTWAQKRGATFLTLAVTRDNGAANALYTSMGMQVVEQYHYRQKPKGAARAA